MKNYWLRIMLGAVAIFVVGMAGVTLARQGLHRVRGVVEGSEPITVPVLFVPFKLDGERLGTIQHLQINRVAPNRVRSVELRVRLADSVPSSRLEPCILVAEGFEKFNSQTTFLCSSAKDTVGEDLEEVGQITLTRDERSFRVFMPRDAIQELTDSNFMFVGMDSAAEQWGDSVSQAAERQVDSLLQAKRPALESLGVALPQRDRTKRLPHRLADSTRTR